MTTTPEPDLVRLAAEIRRHIRDVGTDRWYHPDSNQLPEALAADLTAAGWRWYDDEPRQPTTLLLTEPITEEYLQTLDDPDSVEEWVGVMLGMATVHDWWPAPSGIFDEASARALAFWCAAGIKRITDDDEQRAADEQRETARTLDRMW